MRDIVARLRGVRSRARPARKGPAILLLLALAASIAMLRPGLAQGGYGIAWWTADSGGGVSSGGGYTLLGVVGQLDGHQTAGGGYILDGGFLVAGVATSTVTPTPTGAPLGPTRTPTPTATSVAPGLNEKVYLPVVNR